MQTAAAELGRRVWEPLRPHLGDARTVLIAPDGSLSFFPFAALPGRRPGSYLIEDLAIGYVASGRLAVEALTDPQGPAGRGLLAVGDVDFQADPGQPGPAARPLSALSVVAPAGRVRAAAGDRPRGPSRPRAVPRHLRRPAGRAADQGRADRGRDQAAARRRPLAGGAPGHARLLRVPRPDRGPPRRGPSRGSVRPCPSKPPSPGRMLWTSP